MAKEGKVFSFKGELTKSDNTYFITENVKGEISTYNVTEKLDELIGKEVGISAKTEFSIDPVDE